MGLYIKTFLKVIWNGISALFFNMDFLENPLKICGTTIVVAQFIYWMFIFQHMPMATHEDKAGAYFGIPVLLFLLVPILVGFIIMGLAMLCKTFFRFFKAEFTSQLILERNRNPQVPEIEEVPSFRKRLNQKVNEIKGRKPEINQRLNSVE
jgi:hypothetical protein